MIVKTAGKSITDIFTEDGKDVFRKNGTELKLSVSS